MSVVQAAQVVYGNVEADHSPQRRGGFQVLFRSFSRLTEDVVTREIEPRLFFISTNPQDVKHCFFATQSGSVVVARCVSIASTDQFSRTGLYLAHALVFSLEDFRKFDNNPFHVLDHFEYFKSFEEARAAASADGDIPLVPVPFVASQNRNASCPISRDQLLNLLILGYRCSRSQNQEASIGFYGQASKTLSILRSLFSLLPGRLRVQSAVSIPSLSTAVLAERRIGPLVSQRIRVGILAFSRST